MAELNTKQLLALKLFEQGGLSRKEIASKVGWKDDYLNELCAGNVSKCGTPADLFKKQYQRIADSRDKNIDSLVRENKELLHSQVKRVVSDLQSKKRLNLDEKKLLGSLLNSMAKSTPSIKINNLSYSYTQGLTAEDLMHEFTRLKGIAESSFDRRPVQNIEQGGSRSLSAGDESRD